MKQKILIIEDEKKLGSTYRRVLGSKDTVVDWVGSAEESLTILKKSDYHVVLTDINLPGMNGIDLLRILKKQFPHLKIGVITGGPLDEKVIAAKKEADAFLMKPFDIGELRKTVRKLLQIYLR